MNKRRKRRISRAEHALEAHTPAIEPSRLVNFMLPGLPGGMPIEQPQAAPPAQRSRVILPGSVEKALEREARRKDNPIGQYLKAQAYLKWGLPL